MEMSSRRKFVGADCMEEKWLVSFDVLKKGEGAVGGLTIWMARDSSLSSADPSQQLRERKKELILDPKEGEAWWVIGLRSQCCCW